MNSASVSRPPSVTLEEITRRTLECIPEAQQQQRELAVAVEALSQCWGMRCANRFLMIGRFQALPEGVRAGVLLGAHELSKRVRDAIAAWRAAHMLGGLVSLGVEPTEVMEPIATLFQDLQAPQALSFLRGIRKLPCVRRMQVVQECYEMVRSLSLSGLSFPAVRTFCLLPERDRREDIIRAVVCTLFAGLTVEQGAESLAEIEAVPEEGRARFLRSLQEGAKLVTDDERSTSCFMRILMLLPEERRRGEIFLGALGRIFNGLGEERIDTILGYLRGQSSERRVAFLLECIRQASGVRSVELRWDKITALMTGESLSNSPARIP